MKMKVTRRDLLALAGGSAAGIMLTPAPWKLVDDLAIWTQNWSWIPVPPKGPETTKTTTCTLCPSACAMRARCIGGVPVSLHPLASVTAGAGSLCSLGMTAHHLPWHPARLTTPVRLTRSNGKAQKKPFLAHAAVRECAGAIQRAEANGKSVAVLDMRPDRSASLAARALLAQFTNGIFIPAPGREGVSFRSAGSLLENGSQLGADLAHARTILSFGAPLAEGWGASALHKLLADGEVELIHVEPVRSQTAQIAGRWLPARPGTEGEVALAIAYVLLSEDLVSAEAKANARDFGQYAAIVSRFTPERVAATSGLRATDIIAVARRLASHAPALVIAGEDAGGGRLGHPAEAAILGLNLLLGNLNTEGGLLERRDVPDPVGATTLAAARELDQVEDGTIGVLLIDASAGDAALPWMMVSRKLAAGAEIIALSPFLAGSAKHADMIIPTPAPLETVHEVAGSPAEAAARFAVGAPLLEGRAGQTDPVDFFRQLAETCGREFPAEWMTTEDLIRARVQAIHASGRGVILNGQEESPVSDFEAPDAIFDALLAGGRWIDSPTPSSKMPAIRLLGDLGEQFGSFAYPRVPAAANITLLPYGSRDVAASAACSPLLTKIYQESELRPSLSAAAVNPATIRQLGLRPGRRAVLKTTGGNLTVKLVADQSVMPGTVRVACGPDGVALGVEKAAMRRGILDICGVDENGVWRSSAVQLVEA
jgi:menaquinone reductase, molybdopterin-binding-like subunit